MPKGFSDTSEIKFFFLSREWDQKPSSDKVRTRCRWHYKTLEEFGKANAVGHLVELEFPLSIFCRLLKYEEERAKGRQWVADQLAANKNKGAEKRAPVDCFRAKDTWTPRAIQPGTGLKAWTILRPLLHVESLQDGRTFL